MRFPPLACLSLAAALTVAACADEQKPDTSPPKVPATLAVTFSCADGVTRHARFETGPNLAWLRLPDGGEARMRGVRVASGIHYAGSGYELRGKGEEAVIAAEGQRPVRCRARPL
ncbi:MliC family protein [Oceanicella sp. SM1341]|uniref:MliC family protein n=1 Tax=Oceanicella sp. SM1341 TaxID=1548889 RepID=UPI000E542290|nr:MliC family protein [Oceanicella sp. SM1341]